jgi:hypothetical protein
MGTKACNIYVQPLQHIQHLDLLATSIWNTCNIPLKQQNTWNRRLHHALLSATSTCYLDKNGEARQRELDASVEFNATEWHEGLRCGARWRHGLRQGHDRRMERGRNGGASLSGDARREPGQCGPSSSIIVKKTAQKLAQYTSSPRGLLHVLVMIVHACRAVSIIFKTRGQGRD